MVTDREAREWTSLRRVIDITLRVGYGEESPLRRADIVDEILKGVSNYRNFIRAERDAEWSAKDLYTHDDMDCACENGRLEERGKWSAVAKAAYAELVGYHIKNPLPEPIKGYVCQGRVTLERLGILLGYIEPGHFTKIGTDS